MAINPIYATVLVAMVMGMSRADLGHQGRLEALRVGFTNIERETINGVATVDQGVVPKWLNGNFMRHGCGAFGETLHQDGGEPNYIEHLFDCIEIGSKFSLNDGNVTFTNRRYDTTTEDVYNYYDRNMNESSVFWSGVFSKCNVSQVDRWANNMSSPDKVTQVPHVSWWMVGSDVIAMSETPVGVVIDPITAEQKGNIVYNDNNMGLPPGGFFTNNPAHEQTESDGTLWSSAVSVVQTSQTVMKMSRMVYKVGADKIRHVVGTFPFPAADLTRCSGQDPYPDMASRFGYVHSFPMTENYVIIPETAYMIDPCVFTHYDKYAPFFNEGFTYEPNGYTRLLVMRKSDGHFVANLTTVPVFITHQLGSYEEGELIHMDMLTYDDAGIYNQYTYVNEMLSGAAYTTNVTRITINTTDWSVSLMDLRRGKPATAFEMSNINYAYYGQKYTYGYMAKNFDRPDRNAITKLNVDTGVEVEYLLPEGLFIQEPQFLPYPGSVVEDDGVIMAQGVDGLKKKAFMVIVDAKKMELVAHITAPDLALFGIHERFFPLPGHVTGAAATFWSHGYIVLILITLCNVLCF